MMVKKITHFGVKFSDVNLLSPKSDQHQIFPCNIHAL